MAPTNQAQEAPETKQVTKQEEGYSQRFTNAVMKEFSSNVAGEIALTSYQKTLIKNYFIKIDMVLKDAEVKRLKTDERFRAKLSYTWANVNMQKLALDVVVYSTLGLDPTQPNQVNPLPFRSGEKYDFSFIIGYRGMEVKARKYGLDVPDDVIVELVYSTDQFKQYKRDMNNKIETYEFKVVQDFNRGEVVGGFYYHKYFDKPEKNRLVTFSKAQIDKRRPDKGSPEFWGGMKAVYDNGKKIGEQEVEGWYDEMARKTIARAAYNAITIDSSKIDENYQMLLIREAETRDLRIAEEINEKANKEPIQMSEDHETEDLAPENVVVMDAPADEKMPEATGESNNGANLKNRGF